MTNADQELRGPGARLTATAVTRPIGHQELRGPGGSAPRDSTTRGINAKTAAGRRAGSGCPAHPEHLVEFFQGERVIAGGYRAEDLRVEFDLVKRHAVVDTQIETLSHRAHLRC